MLKKHIEKVSLILPEYERPLGLSPVLQSCLNNMCNTLPGSHALVAGKFQDTKNKLNHILKDHELMDGAIKASYVDRVALYVLWRALAHNYLGTSLGLSTATRDVCKRCPPLGVSMAITGGVIPFRTKFTCKHSLCPSCRMRKVLATWNSFKDKMVFESGTPLDLVHFETKRTFAFDGIATCDLKLDVMQDLLRWVKKISWAYGGMWSIGLTSQDEDVTITAKCAIVSPPMTGPKRLKLKELEAGANYTSALAGQDMDTAIDIERTVYDPEKIEKLFAKTLNTAIWPTSFMLNYSSPISTLFAVYLEAAFKGQNTIGSFGPCDTVRKRLRQAT